MRFLLAMLLAAAPAAAAVHDLAPIASFHYQLQNLDVPAASSSPFPLLVTDYSFDGSGATELTPAEVANLKSGGRKVLAYLSIGEAETYRFYWQPSWVDQGANDPDRPSWLGPSNPQFPDNLKVRFWDPGWQAVIFGTPGTSGSYLDRIVAQGFDGAYLDIVDAYEFWGPDGNNEIPPSPGPTVALVGPADAAPVSASASPTFTWSASGAVAYELHFSGTSVLTKIRKLPRKKTAVLTATSETPALRDWARVAREVRKGDGVTLYWWVVAIDGSGARRSAPLRALALGP